MLIALITGIVLLFSSGGGLEFYLTNVKDAVEDHVKDEAKQKVILAASDDLTNQLEVLSKDVEKQFRSYVKVHSDPNSTAADFDEVTAKLVAEQQKMAKMILDARDKMHGQMTKEEWESVFKIDQ